MNRATAGFGKPAAKAAAPAKTGGGFGSKPAQQQAAQQGPKKHFSTGQGQRGPWARLDGGLPVGQGGTTVFFFPSKDPNKVSISSTSWTRNPTAPKSLRAEITKANIKYEDGVVKIPLTIRMKVSQEDAMNFSTQVLEAQQESAAAEEEAPQETD